MKNNAKIIFIILGCIASVVAENQIIISWESNGLLEASGMQPGSVCSVEWASSLDGQFTNAPISFDGLLVNSNGTVNLAIPMFFRVLGQPAETVSPPDGDTVLIQAGTNNVIDPDSGSSVLIVESFYIDTTEITKAKWDEVATWAAANDYDISPLSGEGKGTNYPVTAIDEYECMKWCNARSQKEGRATCYTVGGLIYKTGSAMPDCNFSANGFRLPTVTEWEYVARGGHSDRRFPWGNEISHFQANYISSDSMSYDVSPSRGYHPSYEIGEIPYTSPVGSFDPTGYGLYDICGNVAEWCWDEQEGLWPMALQGSSWRGSARWATCDSVLLVAEHPEVSSILLSDGATGFRTVCPDSGQ